MVTACLNLRKFRRYSLKNCIVKSKNINVVCGGEVVNLTIVPMTFMKLIEINQALSDHNNNDLNSVLKNPTPLGIAIILYILLDRKSRELIRMIDVEFDFKAEEPSPAQKLFYLLSETNITDGLQNYAIILDGVTKQVIDSTQEPETKKKRKALLPMFWIWRKFTILLDGIIHILTWNFWRHSRHASHKNLSK